MVKATKIAFLLSIFLITSCFPSTNRGLNKLRLNDSKYMVVKIMGKPSSTSIHYDKEILTYFIHDDFFDLIFSSKFPFVGFYPLLRTGRKHWVILEKGHLISHGQSSYYEINKDKELYIKQNNKKSD